MSENIPHVYILIRLVELDLKLRWHIDSVDLGAKNLVFARVSTKEVYNSLE